MPQRATVYVPNLDGGARLEATLASLRAQTEPVDVVVVDNGSRDGSSARVRERFPEMRLIELGENLGFGRAVNRAVAQRPASLIVLVNNDVECEAGFVAALVGARDGAEAVAGVLTQREDPGRIDSAGIVADRTLLSFDHLHGAPVSAAEGAPPPLGPTGGAALFTRAAWERLGGFDERIFAYYEDLDLALRLRRAGMRCALAGGARAVHHHAGTLGAASARKYALTGFGRAYLLRRYGVMLDPRRAARAGAIELAICAGQLTLDRTGAGVAGRVRGWRAARGLERRVPPSDGLLRISLAGALRRRERERRSRRPA
jgi:N-acetylglucosaminyl-diphospho-decaprenol L-rhamnosyltransferase